MQLTLALAVICGYAGKAGGQEQTQIQLQPRSKQPFELVRSIEAIQDQVVLGNAAAQINLPKLIGQIAGRLLAADSAVWRDAKNARAAVVYTLSGGQPRVIRKILEFGGSPELETNLMKGTLAYVEGREAKAKQILLPIDAKTLAAAVGGHIAMIQAALVLPDDPSKAMRLLDQARLLSPGTLVEEAALRREIFLAGKMADLDQFSYLSSQYIRRFPHSVYADNFRRGFSESIMNFGLKSEASQFTKLKTLLNEMSATDQLELYLKIAQSGVVNGKIGLARLAAEQAVRLSKDGSIESARSRLYEAAALILTGSPETGVAELESVDATRLPKRDAELKEAVAAMAKQIRNDADESLSLNEPEPVQDAARPRPDAGANAATAALIFSAEAALKQADALLQRGAP